jgi:serine/threonine-protein phosphatase 5
MFSETFSALPLSTLVGGKYLVLHGGLFSKDGVTLDDIRRINRHARRQPASEGLVNEMLWTDPQPNPGRGPSKRGVGLQFGPDVTKRFCDANGLDAVIRSHEVRMGGYEVEHQNRLVTVFSAPNYWCAPPPHHPPGVERRLIVVIPRATWARGLTLGVI